MSTEIPMPFVDKLYQRVKEAEPKIQVVLGPRQVGKTTGVLQLADKLSDVAYHSADGILSEGQMWLETVFLEAVRNKKLLIIDEIQKIPNWSEKIKQLWDQHELKRSQGQVQEVKVILLGSSSLDLQRGLSESLTGRYELLRVYHWSYEMSCKLRPMSLDEYLIFGGYPGSYAFMDDYERWSNYLRASIIDNVIMKDILAFRAVKSPALFKQAFDIMSHYPCSEISYTKLLGQIQDRGNVELVKNYLALYEGAFLLKELHKYSGSALKTRVSSPKILHACPAFHGCLYGSRIASEKTLRGFAFESVVGNVLAQNFEHLSYWREGSKEVDFVIEVLGQVVGVEVNRSLLTKLCYCL